MPWSTSRTTTTRRTSVSRCARRLPGVRSPGVRRARSRRAAEASARGGPPGWRYLSTAVCSGKAAAARAGCQRQRIAWPRRIGIAPLGPRGGIEPPELQHRGDASFSLSVGASTSALTTTRLSVRPPCTAAISKQTLDSGGVVQRAESCMASNAEPPDVGNGAGRGDAATSAPLRPCAFQLAPSSTIIGEASKAPSAAESRFHSFRVVRLPLSRSISMTALRGRLSS